MKQAQLAKFIGIIFLISLYANILQAQVSNDIATKSDIQYIRSKFKEINLSAENSSAEKIDFYDQSTDGANILIYQSKEHISKLLISYYGETGKSIQEYYFDEEGIIFVFIENYQYNKPIYWNNEYVDSTSDEEVFDFKKSKIYQNRFYFKHDKLIKWVDENSLVISSNDERYQIKETILLEDIEQLLSKINKQ